MATIDTSTGSAAQQALLRLQNPSEQSAGSDNRTVGNQRNTANQGPVNAATAAAQRPSIADTGNAAAERPRPAEAARNNNAPGQGFGDATRVDIRSAGNNPGQPQAANGNIPAEPRNNDQRSGVQINFSASGAVNTSSNPNQAGRNLSLSV